MDDFDEFELQYADDMDALNDLETPCDYGDSEKDPQIVSTERIPSKYEDDLISSSVESPVRKRCISPTDELSSTKRPKVCSDNEERDIQKTSAVLTHGSPKPVAPKKLTNVKYLDYSVTRFDGSRTYLGFHENQEIHVALNRLESSSGLLSVPIDVLKQEVFIRNENLSSSLNATEHQTQEVNLINSQLWVEKYRPRFFVDLLSDEGVNRILLTWLKLLDKIVFGRDPKQKNKRPINQSQQKQFSKFRKPHEITDTLDESGRPVQKVALLFGPPGLGKTTLAHVIARHAGYNVVELNASDDRSPDVFRKNLEAATQMKAVMDQDKRPNCLVIDEIDGAPAQSINVLLSFIQSTGYSKGKKKKGEMPLLRRPIICICNDQYVPALKNLRQIALCINFPQTSRGRLATRLRELVGKEGLKAEMTVLLSLCDKADNDIRSCLSTLQFLGTTRKELKLIDVSGASIGQKDMHQSLFSIWQDIFYVNRFSDREIKVGSMRSKFAQQDTVSKNSFTKVLRAVQGFGDFEKLFVGLLHNFLNVKPNKLNIDSVCQGSDWLCVADLLEREIWSNQLFVLMPYLAYIPVAFHMLFCSMGVPQLSYPSSYYECVFKKIQMSNVLSSIAGEVSTASKSFSNSNSLVIDFLPTVLEVIKPSLRPVSTHLYTEHEKKELRKVIDVMISFNLNYRQERSAEGHYNYVLEPNVEELVHFKDVKTKKVLTYAAKQLIAQEVSVEKMRRSDKVESSQKETKGLKAISATNEVKPLKIKTVVEKPALDFFGRKIEISEEKINEEKNAKQKHDIWFHFKEGYSNAVRRTVYIKDFL